MPKVTNAPGGSLAQTSNTTAPALADATPTDKRRKPRANPGPTGPRPRKSKPDAQTSESLATGKNLKLREWIEILDFVEKHPLMTQGQVVEHFRGQGYKVSQPMLSKKLKEKEVLKQRALETPNALDTKRPRAVTCPEVERALYIWFRSMEARSEVVTGAMLIEKRARFEDQFNIPTEQRLTGEGWVKSFKKTYGIKEHRRHGEAASVDETAAEEERKRLQEIIAQYPPDDVLNGDEGALFAYAQPDRTLSTKQMSGKKAQKFRITLFFVCNSTGTEKQPLMYIGKSAKPRCFKHVSAAQKKKFYYRNNKKAWMTAVLFEECVIAADILWSRLTQGRWVKQLDRKMIAQKRKVLFLLDNFSGHDIGYKPKNVRIEFLAPNMTSRIQPLDAGIIRTFKAYYRRAFCMRALDADEAGDEDIWKLNLWEAMNMARDAWDSISESTIRNCWSHTGILPEGHPSRRIPSSSTVAAPASSSPISSDDPAWTFLFNFISSNMSRPEAEDALQKVLGPRIREDVWQTALSIANDCESGEPTEEAKARRDLETLRANQRTGIQPGIPVPVQADVEDDLREKIKQLAARKLIRNALTVEEFLNPTEEQHIGEGVHELLTDAQIADTVRAEIAAKNAPAAEPEDSDDGSDDEDPASQLSTEAIIQLCSQLEAACVSRGVENATALRTELLKVKRELRQTQLQSSKQLTMDNFFVRSAPAAHTHDAMDIDGVGSEAATEPVVVE